jgi:hypothetical protein
MSARELHHVAVRNLASIAKERAVVRAFGEIFMVTAGGDFEASFVLIDQFWDDDEWYGGLAPNGFVVAIPSRDLLLFTDAGSVEAIQLLQAQTEREIKRGVDHPLTAQLFRRVDRGWKPLAMQ